MTWDHEHVEELLAAHALGGLDPRDQELAERALIEHVPRCEQCRRSLEGFREVAGQLALAAPAVSPPHTLRTRLRRTIEGSRGRRLAAWLSAGAAALLVVALSGWNFSLANRLSDAEARQRWIVDAVSTLGHPEAGVLQLSETVEGQIQLLHVPGEDGAYLVASGMRTPDEGHYRVWLLGEEGRLDAGTFVPRQGVVMMRLEPGLDDVQRVVVTHESSAAGPTPSSTPVAEVTLETG